MKKVANIRTPTTRRPPCWEIALRICLALQLIGAALSIVRYEGSPLAKYVSKQVDIQNAQDVQISAYMSGQLFDDSPPVEAPKHTPEMGYQIQDRIFLADKVLGYLLLGIAVWILLAPNGPLLILLSLWFTASAWASMKNGGDTYTYLSLPGQAIRYLAPIALLIMQRQRRHQDKLPQVEEDRTNEPTRRVSPVAEALLRVATASVFLVHGVEAILQYWGFQDLIIASATRIGVELSMASVNPILIAIGTMDIVLAFLLLFARIRSAVILMSLWALITAFSRMTAIGLEGHHETLLRMLHVGAPLALLLLWIQQGRSM